MTSLASVRASENCGCLTPSDPSDADLYELIDQASDAIALVTGMKIRGRRTYLARPERCDAVCACPCCGLDGIPLGEGDITITSVKIDGDTLATNTYELHSTLVGWSLVRLGDRTRPWYWPTTQLLYKQPTEERTFQIEFTAGVHVDVPIIERAANEIVCYLVTEEDRKRTQLPAGATSANMGGVAVGVDSDRLQRVREDIREGRTGPATSRMVGLYAVERRARPYVYAPELHMGWDLHLRFPSA